MSATKNINVEKIRGLSKTNLSGTTAPTSNDDIKDVLLALQQRDRPLLDGEQGRDDGLGVEARGQATKSDAADGHRAPRLPLGDDRNPRRRT